MVYLVINCVVLYFYALLRRGSGNVAVLILSSDPVAALFLISILLIYPATSIFSFCVYVWAGVTGNLHKRRVRMNYNLPFIPIVAIPMAFICMIMYEVFVSMPPLISGGPPSYF